MNLRAAWSWLSARLEIPPAGMPLATPTQERAGRVLGALSVLWIGLVGFWGSAGLFPEGHFASSAAIGTAAINMWRLHTIYPVPYILDHPLGPSDYYMHHPVGLFWVSALFLRVFGDANWAVRLPAILVAIATPIFLYRTARALYGPLEAGLAAFTYVALPITMAYANYVDLEGPVTLGCVAATWGYVRLVQTSRARFTWPCVLGVLYALGTDWEAGVWLGAFLSLAFAWAYLVPAARRRAVDDRVFGRAWALMILAGLVPLVLSIALLLESGHLNDLLSSFNQRSAGSAVPLSVALAARHVRIELMYPPIAIAIGKLALIALLVRFAVTRDHLDLVALPLFIMATVYYVLFKEGADTHIFWPRPYTGYLPLAVAAFVVSLRQGGAWLSARLAATRAEHRFAGPRARAALPWVAAGLLALPLALVWRDGASLLRLGRESGGRFMEANFESFIDMAAVLRWYLAKAPPTEKMGFDVPVVVPWSVQWEIRPHGVQTRQALTQLPPSGSRLFMLDTRSCTPAQLKEAATRFHVLAVGHYWLMDRSQPPAPLDGYRLVEREPGPIDWFLQGGVEPLRTIEPDPFTTWELRTIVDQKSAPPVSVPTTFDDRRIAYNAAVDEGRKADQATLRARLLADLDLPVRASYDNGTKLLGVRHHRGAARSLTLLFEAGKFTTQCMFGVHAVVTGRAFLSTLPVDPAGLEAAQPPDVPTNMWTAGHLYALKVVYRKRAGHERFTGMFVNGPTRTDGPPAVELLRL